MANQKESTQPVSFEDSLRELEEIVSQLEAGEKPLDESLGLYERGVAALKTCHAVLDKAEKRIRMLVQSSEEKVALREVEVPAHVKKPASRRARNAEPAENAEQFEAAEENQKSAEQRIDSGGVSRQNPPASDNPESSTSAEGGSLFASTE